MTCRVEIVSSEVRRYEGAELAACVDLPGNRLVTFEIVVRYGEITIPSYKDRGCCVGGSTFFADDYYGCLPPGVSEQVIEAAIEFYNTIRLVHPRMPPLPSGVAANPFEVEP